MGLLIATAGFWGAMVGTAIMVSGMALMYFAPVQSLAFRARFKLNLWGAAVLVASVCVMVFGVAIAFLQLQSDLPPG